MFQLLIKAEILAIFRLKELCPVLKSQHGFIACLLGNKLFLLYASVFTYRFRDRKWQIKIVMRYVSTKYLFSPIIICLFPSFLYKISLFNSTHFPTISRILIFASLQLFPSDIINTSYLFWWLSGKETACHGRIPELDPWVGKGMATHSSILAWEILWTEEPGGLQSMGSQRVRHYLAIKQQQQTTVFIYLQVATIYL